MYDLTNAFRDRNHSQFVGKHLSYDIVESFRNEWAINIDLNNAQDHLANRWNRIVAWSILWSDIPNILFEAVEEVIKASHNEQRARAWNHA